MTDDEIIRCAFEKVYGRKTSFDDGLYGVRRWRRKPPLVIWYIHHCYENGLGYRAIAEATGIPRKEVYTALWNWLNPTGSQGGQSTQPRP